LLPATIRRPYRRGFFIGDGTGVGKGREIGGIILDNLRQGRKKHVWVSEKQGLHQRRAKRDFKGVGGDPSLIFNQNKTKAEDDITAKRRHPVHHLLDAALGAHCRRLAPARP
jgi:hypothetical protein